MGSLASSHCVKIDDMSGVYPHFHIIPAETGSKIRGIAIGWMDGCKERDRKIYR